MSDEMHQILHINGGTQELSSATNSNYQVATLSKEASVVVRSVLEFCNTNLSEEIKVATIADFGCSSGETALAAVNEIIKNLYKSCSKLGRSTPEISVYLIGNDFNSLFRYIPAFHEKLRQENGVDSPPCYIAGVPGSFHGRLFPSNSIFCTLLLASIGSPRFALNYVPELSNKSVVNKGKLYISKTSPAAVIDAYKAQYQRDFSSFLKARSKEIITGGRMLLFFLGRTVADPSTDSSCLLWDYLAQAFQILVNEGVIEEERVDSYNAPYYEPYTDEVKDEIEKEGSFGIEHLSIRKTTWEDINGGVKCDRATTAINIAKSIRAGNESMFQNHFGADILDDLFERFCKILEADTKVVDHFTIVLSLVRKP